MTPTTLEKNQLDFLSETVKAPAFSFFFRLHSGSEKQLHDTGHIRSRCHEVFKASTVDGDVKERLMRECDALIDALDWQSGAKSLGLYVADGAAFARMFHVHLPEVYYIGDNFSVYETLYAFEACTPYLLLLFTPGGLELYKGRGNYLETLPKTKEVVHLLSVYAHRASRHVDKDGKGRKGDDLDHKWKEDLFRAWHDMAVAEGLPMYATGLEQIGAGVEEVKAKGLNLLFGSESTWTRTSPEELKPLVKDLRNDYRKYLAAQYVTRIEAAFGAHKMVSSLDEIVDCARAGKAEVLLLEDPKWTTEVEAKFTRLHDAIAETLLRGGRVEFLPEGSLTRWQGAALILRY